MRTVILLGLIAIADAINKNWHNGEHVGVFAVIMVTAMVMDVVDFCRKLR